MESDAKPKYFFVRVNEELYKEISTLAVAEERSINGMAVYLLKKALAEEKK